jgi:hypothetical protein
MSVWWRWVDVVFEPTVALVSAPVGEECRRYTTIL